MSLINDIRKCAIVNELPIKMNKWVFELSWEPPSTQGMHFPLRLKNTLLHQFLYCLLEIELETRTVYSRVTPRIPFWRVDFLHLEFHLYQMKFQVWLLNLFCWWASRSYKQVISLFKAIFMYHNKNSILKRITFFTAAFIIEK